jgi:phosphatidylglycerol:prolipoprotein diacylglycerol transferase
MAKKARGKSKVARQTTPVSAASRRATDRITVAWLMAFALLFAVFLARNFFLGLPEPITLDVGSTHINCFGVLVGLGILFGLHLTKAECLANGCDWREAFSVLTTTTLVGLIFAHVWEAVLYHPGNLWDRLSNFRIGLSSFGGVISAVVVHTLLVRARGWSLAQRTDWLAYGFTGAWLFGRLACFSVHDHPGLETSFFLGVQMHGAVRHDLGLYELLVTIPLFGLLTMLIRRPHRAGTITAVMGLVYLPTRFALDLLRVRDATYAGLTPAQWLCLPALAFTLYFAFRARAGESRDTGAAA